MQFVVFSEIFFWGIPLPDRNSNGLLFIVIGRLIDFGKLQLLILSGILLFVWIQNWAHFLCLNLLLKVFYWLIMLILFRFCTWKARVFFWCLFLLDLKMCCRLIITRLWLLCLRQLLAFGWLLLFLFLLFFFLLFLFLFFHEFFQEVIVFIIWLVLDDFFRTVQIE